MPATRISDVIEPEVYLSYDAENSPEKTAFFDSGIAVRNEALDQKANEGGDSVHIPFWKDLDSTQEPNLSSDNPASSAVPGKATADEQVGRMAYLNQSYSAADLAGEIAGANPMQHVRNRFGTYWQRQWQRRTIATVVGLLAANAAADGGDMINDIALETGNSAAAAHLFSREAFTGAAFTLGDMFESVSAIAVHSIVAKRMVDNDDIEYIRDSQGNLTVPTFLGRRVIIDDGMPVVAGATNGFKYTSVLFGAGAIGYGEGQATVPVEIERQALQGDGGGVEYLIERNTWLIHPFGFRVVGTPTAASFSLAELRAAATWQRVVDRKNVPIAALITNG